MKTFKAYLESRGQSHKSMASNQNHLLRFVNWCEDENIEPQAASYAEIISYIKHLQNKGVKQRTVQIYVNNLRHYFRWLMVLEQRTDNPAENIKVKGIKRNHLYHILKKQELESMYAAFALRDEKLNENQNWFKISVLAAKRNKVIFGLMIWQGLDALALSLLEVKDIKLREGLVYVKSTRRSNERELKLEAHQMMDLMEYIHQTRAALLTLTKKHTEQLFISTGQSHRFGNMMSKLMKDLRIMYPAVSSSKQIRASVIVYWLKLYNLREVQYRAGHRFISSTENYLINDIESLQDDIGKYHPIG